AQLPRRALRRRAAARLDRPCLRQPPAPVARRRAQRQPRPGHLDRRDATALPDQQDRHDCRRRHPRPRDGRQHAPPRDRALRGPRRPRRGQRRLHRGVDVRVRPAHAGRDGRRPRGADQRPRSRLPLLTMSRLLFFTQEAFRALRRNGAPSMAAVVTTVVTVILLGVLIPIFQTTQAKSDQVRDSLEFRVAIYDDATKPEINKLEDQLLAIPHVASARLITKSEALHELTEDLGKQKSGELLTQLHSNPLPANFEVKADDASNLDAVRAAVTPPGPSGNPQSISPIVQDVFDRQEDSKKIEQVTSALKIVLTVITALLIIASLMLVGNTIRLSIYTRRREVEVMRLVGATRWFIRWPFMIEGVVVGFAGGLVAILILWLGKITIVDPLSDTFSFLAAQNNSTLSFPALVAILFGASVLVSAVGSGVTLRRFLKV